MVAAAGHGRAVRGARAGVLKRVSVPEWVRRAVYVSNMQLLCRECNSKKRAGEPTTSNRHEAWYPDACPKVKAAHSEGYRNRYHNSSLPAQPLASKLLILQARRDVRVLEGD
jgi:hypothetical protein